MISHLKRKIGQVASDSVLRKWLIGRVLLQQKGPMAFTPHQPPYVNYLLPLGLEAPEWDIPSSGLAADIPKRPMSLELLGISVSIDPEYPEAFFDVSTGDIEEGFRIFWINRNGYAQNILKPSSMSLLAILRSNWHNTGLPGFR